RYRRSSGELRQQLKWVATALAILPIGVVTFVVLEVAGLRDAAGFAAVSLQVALLFAVAGAIGVAVLQYRLYDLDRVVRKSLAITVLGGAVAALYGTVLAVFGVAFAGASNRVASVAGVVAVVLILQPLRDAVQRLVDRLVHGDLAEPLVVLGALGQRLEAAMESDDVLGAIVGSVAQELRLPYVAVELAHGPGAAVGTPAARSLRRFSIERHGEALGALVVSEREGEVLRRQEERLLTELARQAGVVVDGLRLTNDLARARERAVRAREEERRRIRRDLHDGLGPVLAGLTLRSDVARDLLAHDPSAASGELDALKEGLRAAVVEVRRLVSDLRPAALDEIGLASAVRALAASIAGGHPQLSLHVDVEGSLPELAAAVEVAAYRIAGEAVTNVVRHAQASICRVRLRTNGVLELTVEDDGRGFTEGEGDGIGVRSMHDRAAEVGGTCVVAPRGSGGTVVRVALPISVQA
ncbi:MAG: histidine kinase, partial [Actinomycetota bacterium]|nr:histidine kinase [Actinomycetota bacterium]